MDKTDQLKNMLFRIPLVPENYYRGTSLPELFIPENVLLFLRSKGSYPAHRQGNPHRRFLFVVNLEGDGDIVLEHVRYRFPEKSCILIFPYQYHYFYFPERIKWLFITFEKSDYGKIENLRNKVTGLNTRIVDYLCLLAAAYRKPELLKKHEATRTVLITSLIINELADSEFLSPRTETSPVRNRETEMADEINRFIAMNISHKVNIVELAKKFSYSPSRLRSVYKKTMGISLGKYVKKMRMFQAQKLLTATDISVGDLAIRCGYESLYSFSRTFKDCTGVSPREFRKKYTPLSSADSK